jgi:hypothetical protein
MRLRVRRHQLSIEAMEVKKTHIGMILGGHCKKLRVSPYRRIYFPHEREFLERDEIGDVIMDDLGVEQVDWLGQVSSLPILAGSTLAPSNNIRSRRKSDFLSCAC